MKVLVIDEWLPWPLESGKKIRTYNLLSLLAEEFDILLLAYANLPSEIEKIEILEEKGIRVATVEDERVQKWTLKFYWQVGLNFLSKEAFSTSYHIRKHFIQKLRETIIAEQPDLVHCEWTNLAPFLEFVKGVPQVISSHNIEEFIWRRYAANSSNPFVRLMALQQAKKIERLERKWYPKVECCTAVSEDDARVIRSYGATAAVVENGVDLDYYAVSESPPKSEILSFVASFDVFTNQDAVHFFVHQIFPLIKKQQPEAQFWIVGKDPPESIRRYARDDESIQVTGSVPDVRKFIRQSAISVVPIRIGGGSRLKILEAMAMKKPVVSTSVGAEGITATDGVNIIIGDTPEEFAAGVLKLIADPERQQRVGKAGYSLVESQYDWRKLVEKQAAIWKSLVRVRSMQSNCNTIV